jgi:hypothetical protein
MALLTTSAYQYYESAQVFIAEANQTQFTLTEDIEIAIKNDNGKFRLYVNDSEVSTGFTYVNGVITFTTARAAQDVVRVALINTILGSYRHITLKDIINNYLVAFVGDGKIIDSAKKTDIMFHAQRGIQEFSYDISRVEKIQEIELGPSLAMPMPNDYVNYVKISWVDDSGIERLIHPTRITSKASQPLLQDEDFNYMFDADGKPLTGSSIIDARFKDLDTTKITGSVPNQKINYSVHDTTVDRVSLHGARHGLNAETTQENGMFIIDEAGGTINFSSQLAEKVITLRYISDSLATNEEIKVHKFAEDAIYKYITHGIASSKANMPEYIINRFRKEKRAAMRNAKIRLSNLKTEEITQTMRGKSKQIK